MRPAHHFAAAAATALVMAVPGGLSACELAISAPGSVRFGGPDGQGYDSFAAQAYETDFAVTVENRGGETCNGLISLRSIDPAVRLAGSEAETLAYDIVGPGSGESVVGPAGSPVDASEAIALQLGAGQSRQLAFRFRIPSRQIVPAGTYGQSVWVEFVESGTEASPIEQPLELLATVRSSMSVLLFGNSLARSAAPQGRSTQMDFGTLETGEQMSLSVLVLSNDPYTVDFLSENGGVLAHAALGSAHNIPYELTFDGVVVVPTASAGVTSQRQPTSTSGDTSLLAVRIGEVGLARAGTYEDVLTISIQPD